MVKKSKYIALLIIALGTITMVGARYESATTHINFLLTDCSCNNPAFNGGAIVDLADINIAAVGDNMDNIPTASEKKFKNGDSYRLHNIKTRGRITC